MVNTSIVVRNTRKIKVNENFNNVKCFFIKILQENKNKIICQFVYAL